MYGCSRRTSCNDVFRLGLCSSLPLSAAALGRSLRCSFDIPVVADGNHHIFLGDEVFHGDVRTLVQNNRSAIVSVAFTNVLVPPRVHPGVALAARMASSRSISARTSPVPQECDRAHSSQALQTQVQNGLRLLLRQSESIHQFGFASTGVPEVLMVVDDLIDVLESNLVPFEDVRPGFEASQFKQVRVTTSRR